MKQKKSLLCLLLAMLLLFSACGTAADQPTAQTEQKTVTKTAEEAAQTQTAEETASAETAMKPVKLELGGAVFERTADGRFIFTDVEGDVTELDEYPTKIGCDSAATPHFFDLFGVELAAIPDTRNKLPARYEGLPTLGQAGSPNFEVVKAADLDLIVSTTKIKRQGVGEQYREFGIPAIFLDLSSAEDARNAVTMIGTMFGDPEKAEEIVAQYQARENAILEKLAGKEPRKVALIFTTYPSEAGFYCLSEDHYVGSVLKLMGQENITSILTETYPNRNERFVFSGENITTYNPDVIILVPNGKVEESMEAFHTELETQPYWKLTDAVKNGRVYEMDQGMANLCTPKYLDLMEKLYTWLYE